MIRYLIEFEIDQRRVFLATGMILNQECTSLFNSVLSDEPTGGLWSEEKAEELYGRDEALEQRRDSPCPARRHGESTKGCPAREDGADEEEGVIETCNLCTVGWVCQFGDEDRGGDGTKFQANSDEEATGGKCCDVLRCGLENGRGDKDDIAELDASAATNFIREPSSRTTTEDLQRLLATVVKPPDFEMDEN